MRLGDSGGMKSLHLIVRDPNGRIGQQTIGHAIIAAGVDEQATPSALHNGLLALAFYQAHSPRQAAAAMRVLADLGDVDFSASDFTPRWCQPDQCIAVIDGLLKRRRRPFAGPVRAELVRLRRALTEASSHGCSFYLVEMEPGERLGFECIQLAE